MFPYRLTLIVVGRAISFAFEFTSSLVLKKAPRLLIIMIKIIART